MRLNTETGDIGIGTPSEQPAQQEPVLWLLDGNVEASDLPEDYTGCLFLGPQAREPLREWVGLTPDEILKWWKSENGLEDCDMSRLADFIKVVYAIEAKLKEKNT